jgi:hypothetical protein
VGEMLCWGGGGGGGGGGRGGKGGEGGGEGRGGARGARGEGRTCVRACVRACVRCTRRLACPLLPNVNFCFILRKLWRYENSSPPFEVVRCVGQSTYNFSYAVVNCASVVPKGSYEAVL